ncbi:Uncharacterised protein [Mycobacteroides abscessus]|nr:Uncharacterised protein [Mycobacteroides abscessus]
MLLRVGRERDGLGRVELLEHGGVADRQTHGPTLTLRGPSWVRGRRRPTCTGPVLAGRGPDRARQTYSGVRSAYSSTEPPRRQTSMIRRPSGSRSSVRNCRSSLAKKSVMIRAPAS